MILNISYGSTPLLFLLFFLSCIITYRFFNHFSKILLIENNSIFINFLNLINYSLQIMSIIVKTVRTSNHRQQIQIKTNNKNTINLLKLLIFITHYIVYQIKCKHGGCCWLSETGMNTDIECATFRLNFQLFYLLLNPLLCYLLIIFISIFHLLRNLSEKLVQP